MGERKERPFLKDVSRVADAYGVSPEELANKIQAYVAEQKSQPEPQASKFRIGFVHNIWSAPIIMLLDPRLGMEGVELMSYGVAKDAFADIPYPMYSIVTRQPTMY